jgi:hypothetical protein
MARLVNPLVITSLTSLSLMLVDGVGPSGSALVGQPVLGDRSGTRVVAGNGAYCDIVLGDDSERPFTVLEDLSLGGCLRRVAIALEGQDSTLVVLDDDRGFATSRGLVRVPGVR